MVAVRAHFTACQVGAENQVRAFSSSFFITLKTRATLSNNTRAKKTPQTL